MILQVILPLILVSFTVTQKPILDSSVPVDQPREVQGCDLIHCINGGCGQFEQCLLVAQMEGCNPQLITYSASERYDRCLFGPDGFCSLTPLGRCYKTHLQVHTRTPLPPALSTSPETLAAFIKVLLADAAANTTNFLARCSIPVSAVQQMIGCVLDTSGEILKNCESVMPIATKRYFSNPNRRVSLDTSINNLVEYLSDYSTVCSNFGEWTRWFNDVHPTSTNGSDFETQTTPCGGEAPTAVDCDIDDTYSQLCGIDQSCSRQQVFSCNGPTRATVLRPGGLGLVCRDADQGESITGDLCPCCDYRVRYLCPASDILTISPTYGPASGNTSVTLVGSALSTAIQVNIGTQPCLIQLRSQYIIVCRTPSIDLGQQKEQVADVLLGGRSLGINSNATFTYRRDVKVDKVYNLATLVSGGTEVTVEGTNFLSITQPRMTVTVLYKDNGILRTWVYESTCRIVSDTIIECPVPALINPWEFTNNTRPLPPNIVPPANDNTNILQALTSDLEEEKVENTWRQHDFLPLTGRSSTRRRRRRATCGSSSGALPINDNDLLTYRVDIDLDGQAVSGDHTLEVYVDPDINRFPEGPDCRVFRNWLLASDTEMEITGSRLNDGLECGHYNIRVGDAVCSVQDLFSNRIICHPPDSKPYPGAEDREGRLGVEVLIGNGNLRFAVGCLDYEEQLLDNPYGRYGLIAGLSALALIILLITICCCCRLRQKQKS